MDISPTPIVITGIGVLACNGIGRESFWKAVENGQSGIRHVQRFDTSDFPCHIAGEIWDFNPHDFIKKADVRRWHRTVHQSAAAAKLAVEDSALMDAGYDNDRIAVGIGTSVGSPDEEYGQYWETLETKGWRDLDKFASSASSGHSSTAQVSTMFHLSGPAITIASGCSTGLDSLAWGVQQIRSGEVDAAVVGATKSPVNKQVFAVSSALGILSQRNDEPEKAMRPFDSDSDGLALSESAVVMVLERLDKATARGARILGEVAGSGSASEGVNPLVLQRDGKAVGRAITAALQHAGMRPDEVECAHCHGVSLPMYDKTEVNGYKLALGDHAYRIPISAPKSMFGQAYAVGGLLSAATALMSLNTGIMPPTINHENPAEGCDLDFVPLNARLNAPQNALVTAMSFGGTHTATVLRCLN